MAKAIILYGGEICLVDKRDYDYLSQFSWYLNTGYVCRYCPERKTQIRMHREILGILDNREIHGDHINLNPLDNRRSNLRRCTSGQNKMNHPKLINNTSGYKGVSWDKVNKKWKVYIAKNYKRYFVGRFDDLEDAARAYDEAAKELHGEFAYLNIKEKIS